MEVATPDMKAMALEIANANLLAALEAVLDGTAQITRNEQSEVVRIAWPTKAGDCWDSIDWQ